MADAFNDWFKTQDYGDVQQLRVCWTAARADLHANAEKLKEVLNDLRNINGCWCAVIESEKEQTSRKFVHDATCDAARAVLAETGDTK